MMNIATCPDEHTLAAYLSGQVSARDLDEISGHLDECTTCVERLDSFQMPSSFGEAAPRIHDPVLDAAVARLLAMEDDEPVLAGMVLRDYRLLEKIGEGGMGSVFKARHQRLDKIVALKVIRSGSGTDSGALARFEREMRAVGRLRDPHIVQATDAGEVGGVPFLVMEFVEGENLSRHVKANGPLPPATAIKLIRQAALGLQHAHEAGLIHRDVKPSNLMLTPEGNVKILDLGLAVIANDAIADALATTSSGGSGFTGTDLTSPSRAIGTFHYMAPEQRLNAHAVDARADVYGLGSTLWFLLTGQPPTDLANPPAALPSTVWRRLLAEQPADRYASAAEVAAALAPPRSCTRRRLALAAAVCLTLTLGIVAYLRWPAAGVGSPPNANAAPIAKPRPEPGTLPMTAKEATAFQLRWADALNVTVLKEDVPGQKLMLIPPGGPFEVSASDSATITQPYYLGATEVTVGQFTTFANAQKPRYKTTIEISGMGVLHFGNVAGPNRQHLSPQYCYTAPGYTQKPNYPVTYITYEDAQAYCAWLSAKTGHRYRLPSLAEWKWACRAGTVTRFTSGDEFASTEPFEWMRTTSGMTPNHAGAKQPNAWGLRDMQGNVRELTGDRTENIRRPSGHFVEPRGPADGVYVFVAGGAYDSVDVTPRPNPQVGALEQYIQGTRAGTSSTGFRVLREFEVPKP